MSDTYRSLSDALSGTSNAGLMCMLLFAGVLTIAASVHFASTPPTPDVSVEMLPGRNLHPFPGYSNIQRDRLLGFNRNGSQLLTGHLGENFSSQLRVWNVRDGGRLGQFDLNVFSNAAMPDEHTFVAALSDDGQWLAAVDRSADIYDGPNLRLWSLPDGKEQWRLSLDRLNTIDGDELFMRYPAPRWLRFSPDGESLWIILPGRTFLMDRRTQRIAWQVHHAETTVVLNEDGTRLACFAAGWSVFDVRSRRRISHLPLTAILGEGRLAFADEDRIVVASLPPSPDVGFPLDGDDPRAHGLRLMDAATWAELAHVPDESLLAVSNNGQAILTINGGDNAFYLRDAVSGLELAKAALPAQTGWGSKVTPWDADSFMHSAFEHHPRPFSDGFTDATLRDLLTQTSFGIVPSDIPAAEVHPQTKRLAALSEGWLSIYSLPVQKPLGPSAGWGVIAATLCVAFVSVVRVIVRKMVTPRTHVHEQ